MRAPCPWVGPSTCEVDRLYCLARFKRTTLYEYALRARPDGCPWPRPPTRRPRYQCSPVLWWQGSEGPCHCHDPRDRVTSPCTTHTRWVGSAHAWTSTQCGISAEDDSEIHLMRPPTTIRPERGPMVKLFWDNMLGKTARLTSSSSSSTPPSQSTAGTHADPPFEIHTWPSSMA